MRRVAALSSGLHRTLTVSLWLAAIAPLTHGGPSQARPETVEETGHRPAPQVGSQPVSQTDSPQVEQSAVRTFIEQVATARARTAAWEAVTRLPLSDQVTVGDWAAQVVDRDRALRRWARERPRHGAARHFSDGACDVDIRIGPGELTAFLRALASENETMDLERASRRWPVVWATGTALAEEFDPSARRPAWEDVTPEGVEAARAAAAADALAGLLAQAGALRLTAARRLSDFLAADATVRDAFAAAVGENAQVRVETGPDQVAEATASIGLMDLIRILSTVHQRHYRGDEFHAADFREMALMTTVRELHAGGLGIPPTRHTRPRDDAWDGAERPEWADAVLEEVGRYVPLDGHVLPEVVAAEFARHDAMARLRSRITGLAIAEESTVGALLAAHPGLQEDVTVFLSAARPLGRVEVSPDGVVALRVEMPLKRLWRLVRRAVLEFGGDSAGNAE